MFKRDPLCGMTSRGSTRKKKCQEVLGSADFKKVLPGITHDKNRSDLPLRKCQSYTIEIPETPNADLKRISVYMFQCPFQEAAKPGVYYMFLGSNSDEVFLSIDGDYEKEKPPAAWYSSKPVKGK